MIAIINSQKNILFLMIYISITHLSLESMGSDFILDSFNDEQYDNSKLFQNKHEIYSDSIFNLSIKDSFIVMDEVVGSFVDITWGDNYLWILKTSNYLHDTIFKVDPLDGTIKRKYQIPFPRSYWSLGLVFDSNSLGGPYLWCSITKQTVVGSYYDKGLIFKLRVSDMSLVDSILLPDKSPSAIALYNDSIWITGQNSNIMYIYDIKSGVFSPLFVIRDATYGESIGFDNNNVLVLWLMDINYSSEIFGEKALIRKLNPYSGKILKTYKAPWLFPRSLCCENETSGGPYIWICDIVTNKVYKVKEPVTDVKNEEISNKVSVGFKAVPNPFSEKTKISLNLEKPSYTKIMIYNSLGYKIDILADEYLSEGTHEFTFDGSNLSSGTYYYVLQAGGKVETGQLVLIK